MVWFSAQGFGPMRRIIWVSEVPRFCSEEKALIFFVLIIPWHCLISNTTTTTNSQYLLSSYFEPGTVLSITQAFITFNYLKTLVFITTITHISHMRKQASRC